MWLFYALSSLIFSNIAMFPVKDIVPKDISTSGAVMTQMFTSGYSDELLHFTVNEDTHSISYVDSWKVESNFSFGHVSDKFSSLYFIHEVSEYEGTPNSGAVSRWQIDDVDFVAKNNPSSEDVPQRKSKITKKEVKLTNGAGPCHVNLDEKNGILHVANYNGGSYAAFSINKSNGAIQERIFFESFGKGSNVVPDRQAEAHAHMVFIINDFIYVVDLGSDKIHHYKVTNGESIRITKVDPTLLPPGYGPRHMTITTKMSNGQQTVYVVNELKPIISIFKFDNESGKLLNFGEVETMPSTLKGQAAAEIALHPTEKWLYCSNRVVDCVNCTNGSMIIYKVQENGNLEKIQVQPTSGPMPRYFRINDVGSELYVVDQTKSTLDLFEINSTSGKLIKKQTIDSKNSPTFLEIL